MPAPYTPGLTSTRINSFARTTAALPDVLAQPQGDEIICARLGQPLHRLKGVAGVGPLVQEGPSPAPSLENLVGGRMSLHQIVALQVRESVGFHSPAVALRG